MQTAAQEPLPPEIVEQAIDWMVQLESGTADDRAITACQAWLAQNHQHQQAWQSLQEINGSIHALPKQLAIETLIRPPQQSRRAALKSLLLLAGTGALSTAGYRYAPWPQWVADHGTTIGQQNKVQLADGTQILLNTNSAININYSDERRLIKLLKGEIYIVSGHDARPLSVQTTHGNVLALGTQFLVHLQANGTQATVLQSAVEISPQSGGKYQLTAGQTLYFGADKLGKVQTANLDDTAWIDGMLVVSNMRLDAFLEKLDRYYSGKILCDKSVAGLTISGVYPLKDPMHIIETLQKTLPITAQYRTRYWITLSNRNS